MNNFIFLKIIGQNVILCIEKYLKIFILEYQYKFTNVTKYYYAHAVHAKFMQYEERGVFMDLHY